MAEKRTPTHDLRAIQNAFRTPARLAATTTAIRGAAALGFDRADIVQTIQGLQRRHFYKSMTSYSNSKLWQDVYHAPSPAGLLYVKFVADAVTEFRLLSFKGKRMSERICPGTGAIMSRGTRPITITYKGRSTVVEMPGWYAEGVEDGIHSGADMKVSDRALHRLKAQAEGLLEPEEVRRIRRKLGLSQREAGLLIGGGPNAFQKYEAGDIVVSHAISSALRLLDAHPDALAILIAHRVELSAA